MHDVEVNQTNWFGCLDKYCTDKTHTYTDSQIYRHTHTDLDIMMTVACRSAAIKTFSAFTCECFEYCEHTSRDKNTSKPATKLNVKLPSSASTSTLTLSEVSFNLHFSTPPPPHPPTHLTAKVENTTF